jgi:hypothetical protein
MNTFPAFEKTASSGSGGGKDTGKKFKWLGQVERVKSGRIKRMRRRRRVSGFGKDIMGRVDGMGGQKEGVEEVMKSEGWWNRNGVVLVAKSIMQLASHQMALFFLMARLTIGEGKRTIGVEGN